MAAYCRVYLTDKNRDQFRNSTLGTLVWATFTFFMFTRVVWFADVFGTETQYKGTVCLYLLTLLAWYVAESM